MAAGTLLGALLHALNLNPDGWVRAGLIDGLFYAGGQIFINSLKLMVVPLVLVSLVCGVSNISDGIQDTMWCEGNADGDGVGEWIEFQFDAPTKIANLELLNGIGGSVKYWMLGNRATGAKLEFSNGSSQTIEIKNSGRMQTIPLKPVTTDKVRMSFTSVYKGKEYNDLCISEAYFTE